LVVLAALFLALPAVAADPALTPAQQKAVEEIVRKVLNDNPEIVLQAIQAYKAREEAAEEARIQQTLGEKRAELTQDPDTPEAGNPKGDVTIVEFFDYQCGYCKRVVPMLQEALKEDPNLRLVLKEYPVLGPQSLVAARAAQAAWKLDKAKYMPFHTAMMNAKGQLSDDKIFSLAGEAGLDVAKLKKAMDDPAVEAALLRNRELGQELGINGTPTFVIGKILIPGALPKEILKDAVDANRKKGKGK
jgi:protein-disulfide isomerase